MGNDSKNDRSGKEKKKRKSRKDDEDSEEDDNDDSSASSSRQHDKKKKKKRKHTSSRRRKEKTTSKKTKKRHKKKKSSSSSSDDSDSSSSSVPDGDKAAASSSTTLQLNERLLQKLAARGETLEERHERRAQKRAAQISATFGYTADNNPFNDPNLHEKFTWVKAAESKKKAVDDADPAAAAGGNNKKGPLDAFAEIEKVRQRRTDREREMIEREKERAEENRRKELESYDDWALKEEAFHLQQQRQRSAIRLVEGRETPIDVLAKNILLFGLTEQEQSHRRAKVKYQEKYDAMDALESLEAELEDPASLLKKLRLEELEALFVDIEAFRRLEREAVAFGETDHVVETIVRYWENLLLLVQDEIKMLQKGGFDTATTISTSANEVAAIFLGQSHKELDQMKSDIESKLRDADPSVDRTYWSFVREKLLVHLARLELAELHAHMLVRQLERLETKRLELAAEKKSDRQKRDDADAAPDDSTKPHVPDNVDENFGNAEEELTAEVNLAARVYDWQGRYVARKPRYFNRVKTGYDWNKYNQTHYDHDNPPPKTVQGYKFNVFYPELMDPTNTPQFRLEPADTDEFCIIRFTAGPPYEDIAFKIVNREWSRSRKKGFKCTFERGVLSLYFNFSTYWYRR